MSLHKLTAGDGYEYLTKQVAAQDSTELGRDTLESYYSEKGETPGRWLGTGLDAFDTIGVGDIVTTAQMKALFGEGRHPDADAIEAQLMAEGYGPAAAMSMTKLGSPFKIFTGASEFRQAVAQEFTRYNESIGEQPYARVPDEVKARIRTDVATTMFEKTYGRSPTGPREISGFIAEQTRQKTTAVAGFDLTFTPPKSVSALWAIAPREDSQKIEAAHHRAVARVVASIERDGAYTRLGANGVRQAKVRGLIAAAFTHRDSRAGDPNLHTHVPISNKVQAQAADGSWQWYALDGTVLHKKAVSYSEEYNTAIEDELLAEFPAMAFAARDQAVRGKRPVREIVGVPDELIEAWSSRRAQITAHTADLIARFQFEHQREPTTAEQIALQQQANLATRAAKHEPRSHAEQREAWHGQARNVLGSRRALSRAAAAATGRTRGAVATTVHTAADLGDAWYVENAARMRLVVARSRSVWQPHHLTAEAHRIARDTGLAGPDLHAVTDRLVAAALSECVEVAATRYDGERGEPVYLRDADGRSQYARVGGDYYTTADVLAEERRLIAAARTYGGRVVDPIHVDIALLEHEANKYRLNAGQEALVREFCTSAARLQLALAPAGTGKTSAMAVFSAAWSDAGGAVIGLAPSANAAQVLREDIGHDTDTLAKYVAIIDDLAAAPTDAHRAAILEGAPDWFVHVGPGAVIIVDEAGMASRADLHAMVTHALAAGADVKLIGDDRQLASVDAGGVLRDIAHDAGSLTLTEVVRFRDDAEAAATLALREGRDEAIGFYIDHDRVHVSADMTAADLAYTAWLRDTDAGVDTVMLAPTHETVAELNQRARAEFLTRRGGWSARDRKNGLHRERVLADGLTVGVGDTVITKKNNRRMRLSPTDYVRNGYRYTVTAVHTSGDLTLRHIRSGQTVTVPDWYVGEQVIMGYASTVHGAQGLTVGSHTRPGTTHAIGGAELQRELAYVALTRGTDANHLYFSTAESDPHRVIYDAALHPPTAVDVVRGILGREGARPSVTTQRRHEAAATTRIRPAAGAYSDAIGAVAEHHVGAAGMADIDARAATVVPGIVDEPAWPVLRGHLARIAVTGADPIDALTAAAAGRELDTAADRAAVLDWRLDTTGTHSAHGGGPLLWLPPIPAALTTAAEGPFLARRDELVRDLAADVTSQARAWTLTDAPRWARPLLAELPTADTAQTAEIRAVVADLAVFRAVHGVDDLDRRPTGPDQYAIAVRHYQRALTDRYTAIVDAADDTTRWRPLVWGIDPRIVDDPFWPDLAANLTTAAHAGHDVAGLVVAAAAERALPVELPAAALWWRIAPTVAPATLDTTSSHLHPEWVPVLHELFGPATAEAIVTDHAWPALVTAVASAHPDQWTPRQLLTVAGELLTSATTGPVAPGDVARALAWRAAALSAYTAHELRFPIPPQTTAPVPLEVEERYAHLDPDTDAHERATSRSLVAAAVTGAGELDDEWIAAVLADDAPPTGDTPADDDDLAGMDTDDLATTRPVVDDLRPVDVDDALAALHADLDAARAHRDDLAAAIATDNGPAVSEARAHAEELRERAALHRPRLAEVAGAHDAWAEADLAAEAAHTRLAELDRAVHAARRDDNPTTADDLDARVLQQRFVVEAADAAADDAYAELAAASAALAEIAPTGAVTAGDADRLLAAATARDTAALSVATDHVTALERRTTAAERAARRRGALATLTAPATAATGTDRRGAARARTTAHRPNRSAPLTLAQRFAAHSRAVTAAHRDRLTRVATAALDADHAAAILASPAVDELAAAVARAHAAAVDPVPALRESTDPGEIAARVDRDILRATRVFEHTHPELLDTFAAADRSTPAWADTVETIRRHSVHGNGDPATLTRWLAVNVDDPAAATADELAATLHQRYPTDTAPRDHGPDWLPGTPLGDDADLADVHATRAALLDAITSREPAAEGNLAPAWHELLPPRPDTPGPQQERHDTVVADIDLYRELAGVPDTDARPLGPAADPTDHAATELRHGMRERLVALEEQQRQAAYERPRPAAPDPAIDHRMAPPQPEMGRGPRI